MANSLFCPVCQRKNKIEAKVCAYCGSELSMELSGMNVHTTLNITPSVDMFQENTQCQEYLEQISLGDICIFFEKKQTPIIMDNISDIILGRFFEESESNNLDLDPYEGGTYGVSRRHARITNVNNEFVFEDLNSTNGTWLNGQRIPAGITYPLMSGDQIWLGQFKMQVCFHQKGKSTGTTLFLRDTTSASTQLTANRLLAQFAPYLKVISNFQAIAAECLKLDTVEVTIEKIDASDSDNYVVVQVVNKPESVYLIHKWISPWRREQQFEEEMTDPNELNKVMVQLTSKIIADIAPHLTNEDRFSIIEKALPIVRELATGSIELSFEAL